MNIELFTPPTREELEEYVYSMFSRIRNISIISARHDIGTYVFKLDETEERANSGSHLLKLYIPLRHIDASRREKYSRLFDKEIEITSHLGMFHKKYYPMVHSAGIREFSKKKEQPVTIKHGKFPKEIQFILEEYLHGTGLDKVIKENMLSFADKLAISLHLAYALNRMHNLEGIIHQDIKPGNIILSKERMPKIIDMGTADYKDVLLCRAGILTPRYCSPEQAEQILSGKPIHYNDARTDIFSFGLLMYELFTGRHVHEEAIAKLSFTSTLLRYFMSRPPEKFRPTGSPDIDKIIIKATREKEKRYQSMEDVIADLENVKPGYIK
ncbi:protein kinase [Candidatus Woesearchaeota archaeon]|nr:protein kinase [Candidatus Woesearchaeota archaeon]